MNRVDDVLETCADDVVTEVRGLMRQLNPYVDLITAELVGMVAILRAAEARRRRPPKAPKPQPKAKRPRLVSIA